MSWSVFKEKTMKRFVVVCAFLGVASVSLLWAQSTPADPPDPNLSEAEVEAIVQADVAAKVEALNAGEPCCDDEEPSAYQPIDLDDGAQAMVFDDFALLATADGAIIGLNMIPNSPSGVMGSDVDADCEFIPPDTMFCTYIWGNKIRIMIFKRQDDGTWALIFDSGWFTKQQNPTKTQTNAVDMAIGGIFGEDADP
jgi:hypothetical protein